MSQRVVESKMPLVGGNYAGVWRDGVWQQAHVAQPGWRTSRDGTAVGWLDPMTAVTVPPVHRAGVGGGS